MTLLRELINIPESVHKGDFVLKLTQGVLDPEKTLRDYVVTDGLAKAFDQALQLIESATRASTSKATYLHGSFGSGKSHFMAVLYLLMHQNPRARAIPELASVVDRHDAWLQGKRFLLVPFHLIGARNLESAVLGGYAEHLRRLHPDAAAPAVFLSGSILDNAAKLRRQMGDESFFAALNEAARERGQGGGGWGALDEGWDAESYATAAEGEYDGERQEEAEDKRRLVGDLLTAFFSSYGVQADATGAGFVSMDAGLTEIARHASSLGYHGVVLFLDELILWLASRAGAATFVEQQIEGLVKLVEAERADRPIPIVSFLARQRDLRQLIGDHMPGAERLRYVDKLDHYEGRFGRIVLEDRDLPKIVEKRLLRPKDDDARRQLDKAFEDAVRRRSQVVDVMMGERDRATFRAVYPFTPALVDGLVAVSSVLQRERTALKLLSELLVRDRDVLELGDLVPVGDLWDVLEEGDEPFSEEMRSVFEQAKKLWRTKLRPMLEDEHRLEPGTTPPREHAFHGHARLLKTVLLGALAPEAPSLRGLTVSRLVALNPGSITSPIPGQETQLAARKLREWVALGAGEIHLGSDSANPSVAVELTGVDVESILERVRSEDNQGNRARKVRELLFQSMGIADDDRLFIDREVHWKGTRRVLDVAFGNVRKLPADTFETLGDSWRLVLDYPFDREGFTPNDDLARLDALRADQESQRTVCWLPSFFSRKGQAELGRLVLIDFLLAGERFDNNASHLPATERQAARVLLRNQQTQLRERLRQALETAYGLRDGEDPLIDRGLDLEQHLQSLEPTFEPRLPAAPTFREALERLAGQALEHQFPAHPDLGPELVKKAEIHKVHQLVAKAMEDPDRRLRVEDKKDRRLLERLAAPLRLAEVHEAHLQLADFWIQHFEREADRAGGEMTVAVLRDAIDRPRAMGLPAELQDLLIHLFAERTQRTFTQYGGPLVPTVGQRLENHWGLEATELPSEAEWQAARVLASGLCGVQPLSSLLTANNVADLAAKLNEETRGRRAACEALAASFERRLRDLESDGGERTVAHQSALEVLRRLDEAKRPVEAVRRLAGSTPRPTAEAVGKTIRAAEASRRRLDNDSFWQLVGTLRTLRGDDRFGDSAEALRRRLIEVLEQHELAAPLVASLEQLQRDIVDLITDSAEAARTATEPSIPADSVAGAGAGLSHTQSRPPGDWLEVKGGGELVGEAAIRQAMEDLREAALGGADDEASDDAGERRLELRWTVWRRSAGERAGDDG